MRPTDMKEVMFGELVKVVDGKDPDLKQLCLELWSMINVVYGHLTPNEQAIAEIVRCSPIVEIGACSGYWAKTIVDAGGRITTAYDPYFNIVLEGMHVGLAAIMERVHELPPALRHIALDLNLDLWYLPWHPIMEARAEDHVHKHHDDTMLICWPDNPKKEPDSVQDGLYAQLCLERYTGKRLIYIGEWNESLCANEKFFELLEEGWKCEKVIPVNGAQFITRSSVNLYSLRRK